MANTTSRPRVVRTDQLGAAARAGVALAIGEREKRFGRGMALAIIQQPATTGIFPPDTFDPDPADPIIGPQILVE